MWLVATPYYQFGMFMLVCSFFHLSEYLLTCKYNQRELSVDSFLVNHSRPYTAAMAAAVVMVMTRPWPRPWPGAMASSHGRGPWLLAMAKCFGQGPWRLAMALGHGHGHGRGPWPLAIAPGHGHWPWVPMVGVAGHFEDIWTREKATQQLQIPLSILMMQSRS